MEYFGYILLAIAVLLLMVLIHELGHYVAAKILGFTVEEFSVGFGPKIFGKRRKNGELFSLRLLPLGGYCAFLGENGEPAAQQKPQITKEQAEQADEAQKKDEDLLSYVMRAKLEEDEKEKKTEPDIPVRLGKDGKPARTFFEEKPWKRIIVLLGGVTFNFISAVIFAFVYIWAVGYSLPMVESRETMPTGGYYCENLNDGDIIVGVNGKKITVLDDYSELVAKVSVGDKAIFTVKRNGAELDVEVVKQLIPTEDAEGNVTDSARFGFRSVGVTAGNDAGTAIIYCFPYTCKIAWLILGMFGELITGKVAITSVSGPVGSIKQMADISMLDWRYLLFLLPMLASNLAVFNILPFPALDGAQIIFTVVEWIRRKPLPRKVMNMINFIGMAVLLLFVAVVDILSFVL